jgi:hypothetical protein
MHRKVSCATAKKVNSQIRKKIQGALKDLKNDQPRSASSKLYQAGDLIRQTTKGVWDKSSSQSLSKEATKMSFKLCCDSVQQMSKWKDRTALMLVKLERLERKSTSLCN